jgi:hypothetical protein
MNLPTTKSMHGHIGIRDFRGEIIRSHEDVGFIYHSEVCIWKDPVTAMQRTKALGLLHKSIRERSEMCRQGIPDYLITVRKPGERDEHVTHTTEEFPVHLWQQIASPVWMTVDQGNVLNGRCAKDQGDERHICPLQLDTIERLIHLYSNKGDKVLTPFMGIGSEVFQAVKMNRYGIGFELKESYYNLAKKNMATCVESKKQLTLL